MLVEPRFVGLGSPVNEFSFKVEVQPTKVSCISSTLPTPIDPTLIRGWDYWDWAGLVPWEYHQKCRELPEVGLSPRP